MVQYLDFETVDVFTQSAYAGNPLAIVHIPAGASITQDQKSKIAIEFNLSETIFIDDNETDPLQRRAYIFLSSGHEIPFAGHPTIGLLCHIGKKHITGTAKQSIALHEKCGDIKASFDPSLQVAIASIPHDVHIHNSVTANQISELQTGLTEYWTQHQTRKYPVVTPVKGMGFVLVDLESLEQLDRGVTQIHREMTEIHDRGVHKDYQPSFLGMYLFVIQGAKVHSDGVHTLEIRTRMFCSDVAEDAATGSAACTLAAYLSIKRRDTEDINTPWKKFVIDEGASHTRYRYDIVQGVEMGRKSVITVEVVMKDAQSSEVDQVLLSGQAVKVMEGRLLV